MSSATQVEGASTASSVGRTGPRRVGWLLTWIALLAGGSAAFWQTDALQDYKNAAVQVAVILSVLGISVWTVRSSGLRSPQRWLWAALVWAPIWSISQYGPLELINNGNNGIVGWRWRWLDPDKQLAAVESTPEDALNWRTTEQDYPRFLGNGYWAEATGVEIDPDWAATPPRELWRQPIGAGWSGIAVVGDYAVTQEQRGAQELVVCYEARTGKIAWSHADEARWDPRGGGALGGIGPRATPTVHQGRVYTQGATGIVNCLEARTGKRLWSHDTLSEFGAGNLNWGKAGSPLIVDDTVVVSVGGTDDNSLAAFSLEDGKLAWAAGNRRSSYASPVLTEIAGVRQILVVNEEAVTAHRASDGAVLWEHPWPGDSDGNASASQPVPVGNDRVFLSKGYGVPSELILVKPADDGPWSTEVVWRKPVMRTKMGNVVVRDGYIYGIDDIDMDCVELETGKRQWKKRRRPAFGHGQIILAGDAIVVLSESGEVVLVEASPDEYRELAKFQAIDGVTWNNPAMAGPLLLVRNAEEAACFELPVRSATMLATE